MEFRLLGPLEAWQGGQPVHLGDRQQRYVLAALLLEANKPVPMDRLIEIIWGPAGHTSATTLINGYISRLRTIFKKTRADGLRLDTDPGSTRTLRVDVARIDYFRFVDLRNQARVAQHSGDDGRALAWIFHRGDGRAPELHTCYFDHGFLFVGRVGVRLSRRPRSFTLIHNFMIVWIPGRDRRR